MIPIKPLNSTQYEGASAGSTRKVSWNFEHPHLRDTIWWIHVTEVFKNRSLGHFWTLPWHRNVKSCHGVDYTVSAFFTAAANTPANFVLLSSGKKTDFTDRKAYLPLMSGKMANFTDRMIYLSLSSGKMTGFTVRKGLLPLLSGETANFTDGEGIWSMLSGKMTDFTDRCKTTGILRWTISAAHWG